MSKITKSILKGAKESLDYAKEDKENINDILDALYKHNPKKADEMIDTLLTIATLMNEVGSGRFKGAKYDKTYTFKNLSINVKFKRQT